MKVILTHFPNDMFPNNYKKTWSTLSLLGKIHYRILHKLKTYAQIYNYLEHNDLFKKARRVSLIIMITFL